METAYFRFAEKESNPLKVYSTAITSLLTTSSIFLLIVLLFTQPLANLINYSANKEYIIYFAIIIGIDAFTAIPFARLRKENKAFRFAMIKIINVTVNIGFNLFFLLLCPKLIAQNPDSFVTLVYSEDVGVGYAFISNMIASFVTLLLLFPEIFRIKFLFDPTLLKKMLLYGLPLLVVGLAGMVNEVADKILLKYLVVPPAEVKDSAQFAMEQLGVYGANFKLAILITLFIQMFRYAAEPFFFAQAKEKNNKQVYADVMKYFVIFCLLIFLGVTLYIDLFQYFIGKEFRTGLHVVPIILMANVFLGIFYNLSVWYKLNDLTRYGAIMALIGATVTIVFNIILIPLFGYVGSAWAHFSCYFSMMVISFFWGRKYYPVNYELKSILGYIFLAVILFFTGNYLGIERLAPRLIVSTLLILVFLMVVFVFEKRKLKRVIG
jgi:O-antigen/teichoic acid export membrane protein